MYVYELVELAEHVATCVIPEYVLTLFDVRICIVTSLATGVMFLAAVVCLSVSHIAQKVLTGLR